MGKCVVVATHQVAWIEQNCFDMVVFSGGRNLANGTILFYREKADYLTYHPKYLDYSAEVKD